MPGVVLYLYVVVFMRLQPEIKRAQKVEMVRAGSKTDFDGECNRWRLGCPTCKLSYRPAIRCRKTARGICLSSKSCCSVHKMREQLVPAFREIIKNLAAAPGSKKLNTLRSHLDVQAVSINSSGNKMVYILALCIVLSIVR